MNTIRNTWADKAKGRSRIVTVEIETTKPAGRPEFALMEELSAVVERYQADPVALSEVGADMVPPTRAAIGTPLCPHGKPVTEGCDECAEARR